MAFAKIISFVATDISANFLLKRFNSDIPGFGLVFDKKAAFVL